MWAVAGDGGRFGVADERLTAMSPAELHALTAKLIRIWHPDLRALHARAAVDETFLVRIPYLAAGAAVAASRAAEAETGARHNRLMFWLYRRMTGTPAS